MSDLLPPQLSPDHDAVKHEPSIPAHEAPVPDNPGGLLARKVQRRINRKSIQLSSALADSFAGSTAAENIAQQDARQSPVQRSASDIGEQGFSGSAGQIPYRQEMEKSFGHDFSSVKSYTDGPARKASSDLGAHAYTMGDSVAFKSSNPDKATVAHELTHVVQNAGGGPARKATGDGIETAGEAEAEAVEAAVAAGRPASSAMSSTGGGGLARKSDGEGPALKALGPIARKDGKGRPVQREEDGSKWGVGFSFSPDAVKASGSYELWKLKPPFEIPIVAVPGLSAFIEPSVKIQGEIAEEIKGNVSAKLGIVGSVGFGLQYGEPALAAIYASLEASAAGAFTYNSQAEEKEEKGEDKGHEHHDEHGPEKKGEKKPKGKKTWSLDGSISFETVFKVGLKLLGGMFDYSFEFGKLEIGKLTGVYWDNTGFKKEKLGWEWSEQIKSAFAAVKAAIDKAKNMGKAAIAGMKKGAKAVAQGAADAWKLISSW